MRHTLYFFIKGDNTDEKDTIEKLIYVSDAYTGTRCGFYIFLFAFYGCSDIF